jgi:uncharacterized protein
MAVEIDVRELIGHPGASRAMRVAEPIEGIGAGLASVPPDRPVEADLVLESVVDGILVSGPLSGEMEISCARCLKAVPTPFELEVQELFAAAERADPDEEYVLPAEGFIDLEPMIRDALVLAMPFSPLCRPDCLGLCARCGGDRNLGECSCPPEVDERWAALAMIEFPDEMQAGDDAGDDPADARPGQN